MKNMILLIIASLLSLSSFAQYIDRGVALFSDRDFEGKHIFITDDWQINNSETTIYIESIYVPDGWEVWAYTSYNFTGERLKLTSDWDGRDQDAWKWRNSIRSIRMVRKPAPIIYTTPPASPVTGIVVYEHANFAGRADTIRSNWTIPSSFDFWNDRISSIRFLYE